MLVGVLVAVAFSLGLALGFVTGVAAYGSIYALFIRWQEEKTRLRIIRAEQQAAFRANELAKIREKNRSLYGARMTGDDTAVTKEIEDVLSSGPNR